MRPNDHNRRAPHLENQLLGGRAPITGRIPSKAQLARQIGSVVYFARLPSGEIKIGTTSDLPQRRSRLQVPWSDILAFEPGSFPEERAWHHRLSEHAARGREVFHPTQEVLAAINEIRQRLGVPPVAS